MKNLVPVLVLAVAISMSSSTVFAGVQDLKIFNAFIKAGAETEQFMSQVHLGLDNVGCAYSTITKTYDCNMDDISANEGQGAQLNLKGKKAETIFKLMRSLGAPTDNGMGKIFVSLAVIRCSQSIEGVSDGTPAERTGCSIALIAE